MYDNSSMYENIEELLFSEEDIQKKIKDLAAQVTADYIGKELCILTVLRGASIFLADFTRYLQDLNFTIDFMVLSRGAAGRLGEVKILKDLDFPIYKKHVLLVEDMIDMGESVTYLLDVLRLREPASIKICTLFEKPYRRNLPFMSDYVGFVLPDKFVVGYGLDFCQKYRNLPFVGTLNPKICPY